MNVAVLGFGSWGTSLAILLGRNGHAVTMLGRSEEELAMLVSHRENLRYLPGFVIPEEVTFGLLDHAVEADMTVVAVPSGAVREVVGLVKGRHPLVVVAAKGLEAGSGRLMTEVISEALPDAETGVLSGPNLAVEIARQIPTVAVAAFADPRAAITTRDAFMAPAFRVSTSDDVIGIELAGALKNVLAIGAGMSDGLGFGDNTKGAFLSRGLMEMARLGLAMGARLESFLGPAGVGDLFATAASTLSRNYRVGRALGEGTPLKEAQNALGQVSEGVPTSEATQILARQHNIDMPVFAAVDAVLRGRITPKRAVALLMERDVKSESFKTLE
ncbi:MAG: NAD(P)H-dependent glycerol-3-phosphate dehydrogenase [Fimbriimonas sp.]